MGKAIAAQEKKHEAALPEQISKRDQAALAQVATSLRHKVKPPNIKVVAQEKATTPPTIPLTKIGHVRDELAKVYGECRRGDLLG